jgi:hypothetical protein
VLEAKGVKLNVHEGEADFHINSNSMNLDNVLDIISVFDFISPRILKTIATACGKQLLSIVINHTPHQRKAMIVKLVSRLDPRIIEELIPKDLKLEQVMVIFRGYYPLALADALVERFYGRLLEFLDYPGTIETILWCLKNPGSPYAKFCLSIRRLLFMLILKYPVDGMELISKVAESEKILVLLAGLYFDDFLCLLHNLNRENGAIFDGKTVNLEISRYPGFESVFGSNLSLISWCMAAEFKHNSSKLSLFMIRYRPDLFNDLALYVRQQRGHLNVEKLVNTFFTLLIRFDCSILKKWIPFFQKIDVESGRPIVREIYRVIRSLWTQLDGNSIFELALAIHDSKIDTFDSRFLILQVAFTVCQPLAEDLANQVTIVQLCADSISELPSMFPKMGTDMLERIKIIAVEEQIRFEETKWEYQAHVDFIEADLEDRWNCRAQSYPW